MAIAMRARVAELAEAWRRQGHDLGFGVGIAQGYATLGTIGFEGRYDYAAIGPVANPRRACATRPQAATSSSASALVSIEDLVAAEPAGDLTLKGFVRPVTAYRILHLRA